MKTFCFHSCDSSARLGAIAFPLGVSRSHSDTPHSVGLLLNEW